MEGPSVAGAFMSASQVQQQPAQQQEAAPAKLPGFQSLCNDASLFNDFGHFVATDPAYDGGAAAFKPLPASSIVFSLKLPEDVFDIYEFATDL